jgi:hypothetical protein
MVTLTKDAELVRRDASTWAINDAGGEKASFPRERLRVSLSWKAMAFDDDADRRRYDEHTDDIDLAEVLRRFSADFASRGERLAIPTDPLADSEFVRTLADAYVQYPTSP